MPFSTRWTTAEAAYVLRQPLDTFKRNVERSPVRPQVTTKKGVKVRQFSLSDLLFLQVSQSLKDTLTPRARDHLYNAMPPRVQKDMGSVAFDGLTLDMGDYVRELEERLGQLTALAREIDTTPGREALIKGTEIEAHRIAALVDGGMSVTAILDDYPSLTETQILAAKAYVEAHPKPGRPYPPITTKAALRGAGLEALDEFVRAEGDGG